MKIGGRHIERGRVEKKRLYDLRAAVADCDHALRFFNPTHIESASQSWIVWQLRGRIRASLNDPNYVYDFATAQKLDSKCAMTYLLWARCLWRERKWDAAKLKYEEGITKPHNPEIKEKMELELAELNKQMKEWAEWEKEEEERCHGAPCKYICNIM